ncbi:MAG TPA: hypothetical protein VGX48_04880 [Pyrinomonadaceae bacterium]|jgi:hypothetical protein|nr:hypothetical protein [Pyrinomonadaceae bacterium]
MRAIVILLLFALASVAPQARQGAAPEGPPDLAVVKFNWRKERLPGWENERFGAPVENYEAMRDRLDNERRIQQARNNGNKTEAGRRESSAKVVEDAKYGKEDKPAERPRDGYRYKVQVRNDGQKTIKLVDWDYVFLDPDTQAEVARHLFTSEEKVGPGRVKELDVFVLTPPVRTVSALGRMKDAPKFVEQVVLMRVVYSDGSVWQRP